jgi:hypothetical protein
MRNDAERADKRSPLKDPPPRVAGQSVDEELNRFLDEEIMPWIVMAIFALIFAVLEWVRWFSDAHPHPALVTAIAGLVAAFCIARAFSHRKRLRAIKQGRDGERQVGAMLEDLRRIGCIVIHDLIGDGFNIDHIILSTRGIFCIETKTISKPPGDAKATYDGERLIVPGLGDYSQAIQQVRASSSSLQKLCQSLTGKTYPVRPVVCMPGWYISSDIPGWRHATWVLNPAAAIQFISGAPESISQADVQALVHHLRQHIANQAGHDK